MGNKDGFKVAARHHEGRVHAPGYVWSTYSALTGLDVLIGPGLDHVEWAAARAIERWPGACVAGGVEAWHSRSLGRWRKQKQAEPKTARQRARSGCTRAGLWGIPGRLEVGRCSDSASLEAGVETLSCERRPVRVSPSLGSQQRSPSLRWPTGWAVRMYPIRFLICRSRCTAVPQDLLSMTGDPQWVPAALGAPSSPLESAFPR